MHTWTRIAFYYSTYWKPYFAQHTDQLQSRQTELIQFSQLSSTPLSTITNNFITHVIFVNYPEYSLWILCSIAFTMNFIAGSARSTGLQCMSSTIQQIDQADQSCAIVPLFTTPWSINIGVDWLQSFTALLPSIHAKLCRQTVTSTGSYMHGCMHITKIALDLSISILSFDHSNVQSIVLLRNADWD